MRTLFPKCGSWLLGMLWLATLLGTLLGTLVTPFASAKQTQFRTQQTLDSVRYHYVFDYPLGKNKQQTLDFALEKTALDHSLNLLPSNAELERQASRFVVTLGQDLADRHVLALSAGFDTAIANIANTLGQFNGRLGGRVVLLETNPPHTLQLSVKATGENLLDITVSSTVPGLTSRIDARSLFQELARNSKAIAANANKNLPEGLHYNVEAEWNSGKPTFRYWIKNEKRRYDTGTKNRAAELVRKTNATLRTNLERYKQNIREARNVLESAKSRARQLLDDYTARMTDTRKSLLNEIKRQKTAFYAANYLLPVPNAQDHTFIDYARVARQSVVGLRPLSRGLKQAAGEDDERKRLQLALNFFQNIPYNDLLTGKVRGFKGFSAPLEMIATNLGDCDSKSTAMMALLRTLLPHRKTALFLVPEHAFLGVAIEAREGDATYTHLGQTYVLMEPTGPSLRPVGQLLSRSQAALDNDQIHGIITMQSP